MKNGKVTIHENNEKKNTITGVLVPLLVSFRTNTYAVPAPNPPNKPIRAGKTAVKDPVGRMINKAPIKATTVVKISNLDGISFSINIERMIAKNGESLFNMLASAIPRWSTA